MAIRHDSRDYTVVQGTIITPTTRLLDAAGYDWAWAYVTFRAIPEFPGYCVGDDGSVWTRRKQCRWGGLSVEWRPLRPSPQRSGHLGLHLSDGSKSRGFRVHRLVAHVFLSPCPPGQEVRHKDGNPANNRAWNLTYGTRRQNIGDAIRHGTLARGLENGSGKFSDSLIAEVKALLSGGLSCSGVAAMTGMSRSHVHRVGRGLVRNLSERK